MTMKKSVSLFASFVWFAVCGNQSIAFELNYSNFNDVIGLDDTITAGYGLFELNYTHATSAAIDIEQLGIILKSTINRVRQKHKKIDIVFLIDSSSSVGKTNFRNEIQFVVKFLSDFNVSYNYTRVAIVTFSSHEKIV